MVPGVILAAGRSTRMGNAKPLLRVGEGGPSFVQRLATSLLDGGAADALVVGRSDDEPLVREIRRCQDLGLPLRFVENPHADRGQLSSVLAGLNAADRPGVTAVLITPVDAPLVRPDTVALLIGASAAQRAPIVRATYRGRHGHPVIFAREVFEELRAADPALGARSVVQAHSADTLNLDVDDPGVLQDIDSPDDYSRLLINIDINAPPSSGRG
jgi:CTP:molybdopterin cytidylyltransferase MocA